MTSLLVRKKMRGVRWLQAAGSQEYEIVFFCACVEHMIGRPTPTNHTFDVTFIKKMRSYAKLYNKSMKIQTKWLYTVHQSQHNGYMEVS